MSGPAITHKVFLWVTPDVGIASFPGLFLASVASFVAYVVLSTPYALHLPQQDRSQKTTWGIGKGLASYIDSLHILRLRKFHRRQHQRALINDQK